MFPPSDVMLNNGELPQKVLACNVVPDGASSSRPDALFVLPAGQFASFIR